MADISPKGEGITVRRSEMPWVILICENNHRYKRTIWGRSLLEWPPNVKSLCPHCGSDKYKIDLDFDYASAVLREKSVDPNAYKLLSNLQEAAKMAYSGDEAGAYALLEEKAKPLLPHIDKAIKHGGWSAAIVLIFYMLTSCTPDVIAKIDVKLLSSWGSLNATLETPPLQIGRGRVERTSEPLPEAGQTRQQRRQIERQTNKRLRQRAPQPSRK